MARKKGRAVDGGVESTGNTEKYDSKGSCPHIGKGVDIGGLKKAWKKRDDVSCQICRKKQYSTGKKTAGVENDVWVCMNCGHIGCGNTHLNHAMDHYNISHSDCHSVVAIVETWTVRCLQCRHEINLDVNAKASDAVAYLQKNFAGYAKEEKDFIEDNITTNSVENKPMSPVVIRDNRLKPGNIAERRVLPILGLENIGNTCYMNAILQCLAQTPDMVSSLEDCCQSKLLFKLPGGENLISQDQGDHLPPLEGILGEGGQLTKALFKVLSKVRDGGKLRKAGISTENPGEVLRTMKKLSNTFYVGEQHDSHELLRLLLEGLRTEDLKRYQRGILNAMSIGSATKEVLPKQREFLVAYKKQAMQKKLIIDKIFGGSLVSILKCLECDSVTTTFESFMDISLPVESDKLKNVEKHAVVSEVRLSKYQQKKERKLARKAKKPKTAWAQTGAAVPLEPVGSAKSQSSNESGSDLKVSLSTESRTSVETVSSVRSQSSNESGSESEADVEDNLDSENTTSSAQDEESRVSSEIGSDSLTPNKYQDCDLSTFGEVGYEDVPYYAEKVYPYTSLIFGPYQDVHCGPVGEPRQFNNEPKVCDGKFSPELSVVESSCSPEPSTIVHECSPEPSTLTFGGSPEPSLNEDFGSCEGGRGSPVSSIEHADWEEEDSGPGEYNKLVQAVEIVLQVTPEQENIVITQPEPLEFPSSDSYKEENMHLSLTSTEESNYLYENVSGRYVPCSTGSSYRVSLHPGSDDKDKSDEQLTLDTNHYNDLEKQEASDETFEILVEEARDNEQTDACEPKAEDDEKSGSGQVAEDTDHSDTSGSVWASTLAPPLELENATYTLEHCLRQFFSEEILSGANRIGCARCTRRMEGKQPKENTKLIQTNALKQLLFLKLPEVLTIHLKRFEVVGSRMSKITRRVSFPFELDVSPYTSAKMETKQPDFLPLYHLFGVIEHSGHLSSGHYVAYVKVSEESGQGDFVEGLLSAERCMNSGCKESNLEEVNKVEGIPFKSHDSTAKWYFISDTLVKEISIKEVCNAEAYILFYRKV